ncbi:hypothetical protein [Nodosilinea nodulosa]|uniref:hypothetical protein n=1 Tax=Nodosilinea nodulosa TaxID=416001 RepID=UPI0002D5742B|nr:hypothetical protein [Nodosilinea nodulosa]
MTTSTSVSRQPQKENRQNPLVVALVKFWEFSNFYGEYSTVAPKDRRNYVESLAQK